MKKKILENIKHVLLELNYSIEKLNVQKTKNPNHGDYSCNIAMILAKQLGEPPAKIAKKIISELEKVYPENFSSIQIAGPGFINFKIQNNLLFSESNASPIALIVFFTHVLNFFVIDSVITCYSNY